MSLPPRWFGIGALVFFASVASAQSEPATDAEQVFVDALSSPKYYVKGEYKTIRAVMAGYFAKKYDAEIRAAFDEDYDALSNFLKDNPEIRDTFYTALNDDDDIPAALKIFRDIYKLGPDKLKTHSNVAIAICVVWDKPNAVYDYVGHQWRTRSTLPVDPKTIGWKENYDYLLAHEGDLKGVVQNLPWEFLVHMVNNRTPQAERDWAIKNYIKKRAGIGANYKEIVYDDEMLRTEATKGVGKADCRLTGQEYTLAGIKKYGGVCAQQADFAARVAKSIAVPAEYISGEGNSGGRHAWVMWVEIKSVTKEKIDFAMMSEGRYSGDQYYIGHLVDPKSGKPMTDRDMERRLTTIGIAPSNARHADLMMRMYPYYKEKKALTGKQQLAFLKSQFEIFPHCERAWVEMSKLAQDGETIVPLDAVTLANRVFTSFSNYPDFSWSLFDPLLTNQKDKAQRSAVYERAVLKYETLGRPDLACECRLKWAEYMEDAKEYKKAADGLAQTISKFPAEGRYVPKVMDKLADICSKYKDGTKKLAKFYIDFLAIVPKTRGNTVTAYAVKVHQQAFDFFQANNMPKEAATVGAELKKLKGK